MTGTAYRVRATRWRRARRSTRRTSSSSSGCGEVPRHQSRQRRGHRTFHRGARPCVVGRSDGGRGRRLARLRGDLDAGGAQCAGQRRRLAELSGERGAGRRPGTTRSGPARSTAKARCSPTPSTGTRRDTSTTRCTGWRFGWREAVLPGRSAPTPARSGQSCVACSICDSRIAYVRRRRSESLMTSTRQVTSSPQP